MLHYEMVGAVLSTLTLLFNTKTRFVSILLKLDDVAVGKVH